MAECAHPDASLRYLNNADAIAELLRRQVHPSLIDLVQSTHTEDDVDVHVCGACGELLLLMPNEDDPDSDVRPVWMISAKGKGMED
jgi:hypothetical protein